MTQKAQELFEQFLKEYCDTGYIYIFRYDAL